MNASTPFDPANENKLVHNLYFFIFLLSSYSVLRRLNVSLLSCSYVTAAIDFPLCLFSRVSFMSNQKQQKPTLTGQRFKTRKRGEKL